MYILKYVNPYVYMDFLYINIAKNYNLNYQKVVKFFV